MARGGDQCTPTAPRKGRVAAFSRMEDEPFDYSEEAFVYDGPARAPVTRDPTDKEVVGIPPIGFVTIAATGEQKPFFTISQGYNELKHLWPNQQIPRQFQSAAQDAPPRKTAGAEAKTSEKISELDFTSDDERLFELAGGHGETSRESQRVDTRKLIPERAREDANKSGATQDTPTRPKKRKTERPRADPAKRVRSTVRQNPRESLDKSESVVDDEDLPCSAPVTVPTKSFNIGDQQATRDFFHARFAELTMNPSRRIAEHWINVACPGRRKKYGPYHHKKPSEMPSDPDNPTEPDWWPRDIVCREPTHMNLAELIPFLATLLFLHRVPDDEGRPRINWVAKLRERAMFLVNCMEVKTFTASKDVNYSQAMKDRALNIVLPDIFEVAQKYEDHVAQYGIEGADTARGPQHSWYSAPKPQRPPVPRRKRKHAQRPVNEERMDVDEASNNNEMALSPAEIERPQDGTPPQSIPAADYDGRDIYMEQTSTVADSRSPSPVIINPGVSFGQSEVSMQSPIATPAAQVVYPLQNFHGQDFKIDPALSCFPTMPAPQMNIFQHLAAPGRPIFPISGPVFTGEPAAQTVLSQWPRGWIDDQMGATNSPAHVSMYPYGQDASDSSFTVAQNGPFYSMSANTPFRHYNMPNMPNIPNGNAEYGFDSKPPIYPSQEPMAMDPSPMFMPSQHQQTALPPQYNNYYNGLPVPYSGA